ncbi:Gfo/Idh/MocA family protein [Microlunatus ginsengisoli]|uniref:Gfo/Idh/MocA family oxidoreductase n=1 Tax=Microlunatus ginsengisoli TaxID=363863 RepID=A0ABP6ZMY6_9ACTN
MIGCGAISGQYLETIARLPRLSLVAVADRDHERAERVGAAAGASALPVPALLADPRIDAVLNLTVPAAHAEVALAAIEAGKIVYGEKPLAASLTDARRIVDAAAAAGVRIGCAPDTVLGTGIQTSRRAIDDGLIGTPVAASATMLTPGHERWHPDPDFYYQPGGGPLLDMGPYYVTALITLLGPVTEVVGMSSRSRDTRAIGSGPRAGGEVPVAIDTHVTGVLRHASGALSTLIMSFDAVATRVAPIEVHGTSGSLAVPDPNRFGDPTFLHRLGATGWEELPVSAGYVDAGRGYGLADLAIAAPDREPRSGGRLALHVLDVMESLLTAAVEGRSVPVASTADRPDPVPLTDLTDAG